MTEAARQRPLAHFEFPALRLEEMRLLGDVASPIWISAQLGIAE
jgi:hypothetical protein